jgi:hypothetical protein
MDVAEWLRALGLEQYEATFRENAVTASLLPNLTADDLKDLDVTSVGHRRQILDEIAARRIEDTLADDSVRLTSGPPTGRTDNLGSPEAEGAVGGQARTDADRHHPASNVNDYHLALWS